MSRYSTITIHKASLLLCALSLFLIDPAQSQRRPDDGDRGGQQSQQGEDDKREQEKKKQRQQDDQRRGSQAPQRGPERGSERGQDRGQERGQERGQDRAQDRGQDRGQDQQRRAQERRAQDNERDQRRQQEQGQRARDEQRRAQQEQDQRKRDELKRAQDKEREQQRRAQQQQEQDQRKRAQDQDRRPDDRRRGQEQERQAAPTLPDRQTAQPDGQSRDRDRGRDNRTPGLPGQPGQSQQVETQRRGGPSPENDLRAREQQLKLQAETQRREVEDAKRRGDQARLRKIEEQQRVRLEQQRGLFQQQQAVIRQQAEQRRRDDTFRRGAEERETRRRSLGELVLKKRQEFDNEKRQDRMEDRLRLRDERLRGLREQRRETVDRRGQTVIQEQDRTIYRSNNQFFIQKNETDRWRGSANLRETRGRGGNIINTIRRPDGSRVEIEVDTYGRPLRRTRILSNGRRYNLFRNNYLAPGAGFAFGSFLVDLPPPRVDISREEYIVDTERASEEDIYSALEAPPVEPLDRGYTLDEVRASVRLRERMRSVNIDTITFDFGSWEVTPDQAGLLETVASVIKDIVSRNPGEVFLIEGHTDAVGTEIDNLTLSDRRAEAVADVLVKQFDVPLENLVTQGYGEQHLLLQTEDAERRNRRVMVRRVTPLLATEEPKSAQKSSAREEYREGPDVDPNAPPSGNAGVGRYQESDDEEPQDRRRR